jgi:hypothetical protein
MEVGHLILAQLERGGDGQSSFTVLELWDSFNLANLDEASASLDFDSERSEFIDSKELFVRLEILKNMGNRLELLPVIGIIASQHLLRLSKAVSSISNNLPYIAEGDSDSLRGKNTLQVLHPPCRPVKAMQSRRRVQILEYSLFVNELVGLFYFFPAQVEEFL